MLIVLAEGGYRKVVKLATGPFLPAELGIGGNVADAEIFVPDRRFAQAFVKGNEREIGGADAAGIVALDAGLELSIRGDNGGFQLFLVRLGVSELFIFDLSVDCLLVSLVLGDDRLIEDLLVRDLELGELIFQWPGLHGRSRLEEQLDREEDRDHPEAGDEEIRLLGCVSSRLAHGLWGDSFREPGRSRRGGRDDNGRFA